MLIAAFSNVPKIPNLALPEHQYWLRKAEERRLVIWLLLEGSKAHWSVKGFLWLW
jgi:hypothetical protein